MDKNYDWGCFVFAYTRNKAKAYVAKHFNCEYIDMRSRLLKRGLNLSYPMIVDCPEDTGYDLVLKCGYSYMNEEEYL